MKLDIYDTTARDGAQSPGVAFTDDDRLKILAALDALGVDLIETGYFTPVAEEQFIARALKVCRPERLSAFIGTRRPNLRPEDDLPIAALAANEIKNVTVFGKCSAFQVSAVLRTTLQENLAMIADTVGYFKKAGKRVIFDAEHFFDGRHEDPDYAFAALKTAVAAGADAAVLCDTNGGMLPDAVAETVAAVKAELPETKIGIHCHNDIGMAVAGEAAAVRAGAAAVSGTFCGIGERCGNADLCTLIPLLQLKLGYNCIAGEKLTSLTRTARYISEVANLAFDESEPFVGGYAFTHKAGTHIDAVIKNPRSFEHISPEAVGNRRSIVVSELCGRAAIVAKSGMALSKDDPRIIAAAAAIRGRESEGYNYEDAAASLTLVIREAMGTRRRFFELVKFSVNISEGTQIIESGEASCEALIKVRVGDSYELTAAEGNGPVNALDGALRKALSRFYPRVETMRLTDYKVRVLNSTVATASTVRVQIETTDGESVWRTVGVSADIIEASRQALCDSYEYLLSEKERDA
jgi:2-isopropylmalate synthase